jgi:3-oxoadipate enol-lactonase
MPFLERDTDVRLHWRSDGATHLPPLLLGNSLGADLGLWDAVLPALQQRFRVVRFDNRGHGASVLEDSTGSPAWSMETLASDALAVADAAGVPRFHYCGLSIGGMVGMWLGMHHAQRLRSLVLSNTAAQLPAAVWQERIAAVQAGGVQALADSTLQRWFTPGFAVAHPELVARTRASFLAVQPAGYIGCACAIRDMALWDGLPGIDLPTLVIAGRHDPSTPPALGEAIAQRIPGARLRVLESAHIAALEQPAAFSAAVVDFVARC